jgi:hypothetical protein
MRWECGECGECFDGAHPPEVCPSCGLAGGIFVLTAPEPDDVTVDESDEPILLWTRLGLEATRPMEARWSE